MSWYLVMIIRLIAIYLCKNSGYMKSLEDSAKCICEQSENLRYAKTLHENCYIIYSTGKLRHC